MVNEKSKAIKHCAEGSHFGKENNVILSPRNLRNKDIKS